MAARMLEACGGIIEERASLWHDPPPEGYRIWIDEGVLVFERHRSRKALVCSTFPSPGMAAGAKSDAAAA
jgi:hypothetical protein